MKCRDSKRMEFVVHTSQVSALQWQMSFSVLQGMAGNTLTTYGSLVHVLQLLCVCVQGVCYCIYTCIYV